MHGRPFNSSGHPRYDEFKRRFTVMAIFKPSYIHLLAAKFFFNQAVAKWPALSIAKQRQIARNYAVAYIVARQMSEEQSMTGGRNCDLR